MPSYTKHVKRWINLYETSGLSLEAIAEQYECSPGTVHYHLNKHGVDTSIGTVEERFWSKVNKSGPDECWEWNAGKQSDGYGSFWWNGSAEGAHRVSYRLCHEEEIEEGKQINHHCDNPPCVNPKHLYAGTQQENGWDQSKRERRDLALNKELVYTLRCLHFCDPTTTYKRLAEEVVGATGEEVSASAVRKAVQGGTWPYVPFPSPVERNPYA